MEAEAGAPLEAGMAEVNGTRLYYEAYGAGPPIVFVHGFTLDRRMWAPQARALAERFRVICYDARGFGRSAMPGTEAYRHCEDAAALCEHLKLSRVVVVGHSIGAHQTLELSLSRPDLVAGWVSVCMAGLGSVPFPESIAGLFGTVRRAVREQGVDAAKRIWSHCDWFAPVRETPSLSAALDAMIDDYSGWHWLHDNPAKNLEPPAAARLAELRVPALIVTGARDLPYNDSVAAKLLESIAGATALRMPEAGHMASMERPEAFNRAVTSFVLRTSLG